MLNGTAMALDRFVLLERVSVIASFDNNPIYNHRVLHQRKDWGESGPRAAREAAEKNVGGIFFVKENQHNPASAVFITW